MMEGSWLTIVLPPLLLAENAKAATSWATVVVWLLCIVLFGWALFGCLKSGEKLKRELKELFSAVEGMLSDRTQLDSFGEYIKNNTTPLLARLWSDYEATLIRVSDSEKGVVVYSTVPAECFFSKDRIFHSGAGLYAGIPSILTGLGILGTFLGLSLGLVKIDLASNNLETLKEGLKTLLSGANTAFITSVWGIFLSLILTGFQKWYSNQIAGEIDKICSRLDALFVRKPAEVWLSEIYQESLEQTAQLKRFNDELAWSIATALDEKLAVRLTPALENLLSAIDRLTKTGSETIAEVISKNAGAELARLSDVLQKSSSVLDNVLNTSSELLRQMSNTINKQLEITISTVEKSLGGSATRFDELTEKVEHSVEQMQRAVVEQLSIQKQQFEELLGRAQETTRGYLEDFLTKVSHAVDNLNRENSSIVTDMGDRVFAMLEELQSHIKELGKEYTARRDEMHTAIDEITMLLTLIEGLVKEAAGVLDEYRKSAQPVREAGEVLARSVESFANAGTVLHQATLEFKGVWNEYRQHSVQAVSVIKESLSSTERSWRAYENKFGELRQQLEAVFDNLRKGLSEYNAVVYEGLNRCLVEIDKEMSKAIASLAAGIGELTTALDDFMDFLEQLKVQRTR